MHLTNYSVNKTSPTYVDESTVEDIFEINSGSKRTLTALWKQLERDYAHKTPDIVETIKENIKDSISKSLAVLLNSLQMQANPSS